MLLREKETEKGARGRASGRAEMRALVEAGSNARKSLLDVISKTQRLVRDRLPAANPLAPQAIQALLARDERLLAYSVAGATSYAFVVSQDEIEVMGIPTKPIQDAAEAYLAILSDGDALTEPVSAGRTLFQAAVPESLWKFVKKAAHLYLMADGILNRIPFETLVVGEEEGRPAPLLGGKRASDCI